MKTCTRRHFLKTAALAGGSALSAGGRLWAAPGGSPNGDIRVAVVGVNGKGNSHISAFRNIPGVKVAALCDVDSRVLAQRAKEHFTDAGATVATYADYRRLLDDASIDAVVIATPNHWHALMTIWACQAGKDVYVEKPISHHVWEGRQAVAAVRKYGRIVQAGTQSRSDQGLQEAVAYVQAGQLGQIQWARGLCYKPRPSIGKTSGPQPVPAQIDYDLWTGPAPLVPPRRNSPENGPVHYDWHWFWHYGGGDLANQGIHQVDVCRWFLGQAGLPPAVASLGGRFGFEDDAETPNTQIAVFDYAPAPIVFEVRGLPRKAGERAMDAYRGIRIGAIVQCEGGYFAAGESGGGIAYDNAGRRIKSFPSTGGGGHAANFIAAMRSRRSADLAAPVEEGHVSSALCHLANISYRLGADRSNASVQEAVRDQPQARDAVGRMLEHLEANGVATGRAATIMGPRLEIAAGAERFTSRESYDAAYWGNTMLRHPGRPPFVVPALV